MQTAANDASFFGTEPIRKILLKVAPPVMLAQLIQSLYNIVDSFFIGNYSSDALTALSVIFPIQLVIVAFAVGTGVGANTYMARKFAQGKTEDADAAAGCGMVLEFFTWVLTAVLALLFMRPYVQTSASSPSAVADGITYGTIVCVGSLGSYLEGNWTKVHQAHGNMRLPMIAQVCGALINIVLDPLLIFGIGPFPALGVAGAAYATVCGQIAAAVITGVRGFRRPPVFSSFRHYAGRIYFYGYSSILMQALCTVYIIVLNVILAGFSDSAVTVLGLYYKMQSFFFIPLLALSTCIVPVISYNYAIGDGGRCRETMRDSLLISALFMAVGILCFCFFPSAVIRLFSDSEEVLTIGKTAFPIIGTSFLSAVFSLLMPVFFQATGDGKTSLLLALTRQIFCLIPSFWLFSKLGLSFTWLAFPVSETIAGGVGLALYLRTLHRWKASPSIHLADRKD